MAGRLGIIACGGVLPVQIAQAYPKAFIVTLNGVPHNFGTNSNEHQLEKIGELFEALKSASVTQIVFAGSLSRPVLDPSAFDPVMTKVAPRLFAAMQLGDDSLLREVIEIFEEQNFEVLGAHELIVDLTAGLDMRIGPEPDTLNLSDIARARDILLALSPLDVGQGCVVSQGQCLGIETLQGTDFMLKCVADTPNKLRQSGVFMKAAKHGQDLRIDMPAIGPWTIAAVVNAGLAGLVIEAEKVMILEREKTLQAVKDAGIFLIAQAF